MAETKYISKIKVPNGDVYQIKDAVAVESIDKKIFFDDRISGVNGYNDLSVVKLSADEYANLLTSNALLSNAVYVVEDSYINAYGQQIKNLSAGTDLSDAVTVEQLSDAIGGIRIPTDLSSFSNSPGYLVSNDVKLSYSGQTLWLSSKNYVTSVYCGDFIKDGMLSTVELCSNQLIFNFNVDAGNDPISVALSNFIDETQYYKKSETSSASQISSALASKITVDDRISGTVSHPDLSVIRLDSEEYKTLVSGGNTVPNAIYVVESENEDVGGRRVVNMAPGVDLSDAVNMEQLSAVSAAIDGKVTFDDRISGFFGNNDLSVIRLSVDEYEQMVQLGQTLSNCLYIVDEPEDSGWTPVDLSDLATKTYVDLAVQTAGYLYPQEAVVGYHDDAVWLSVRGYSSSAPIPYVNQIPALSASLSDYYKKSETSSASQISGALSTIQNCYTKSETSSASQISAALAGKAGIVIKTAGLSSRLSDLVINDVTREEYIALSAAGQTVSSELYLVRPDTAQLDAHGDWIVNVKDPELSSDAASKAYVDSQLSNAGGGFSFERYWPPYNSTAQTYVIKPGKFNILSNQIQDGDNLIFEDYTKDNVYKVQLTGNASTSAAINILVDTNSGDVLPGAYRDDTIASCLTVMAPKQVYNFEVSYGNLILNDDYNGDALRTLYPFPMGAHAYGEEGYEAYGVMPLDNACNHLSVGPGEEYDGKTFYVVIPGRVRTNKVRRMRRFSIMLRDEFAERGMRFQFPSRDVNNGQVQYTFVCGSQYAQNPKHGDVVTFDEYQKDRFYVDVKNVDQNVWYQFTTPTPSEGVVAMRDRCVNYVNIKATASVTWEWSDGGGHASPYYDEICDPPEWTSGGDLYEIINYDAGPNAKIIYAYPDPNDHDESTIIVAQKVTSYVTQNGVIQMPSQNPGKCRDFLLRLRVDQDPPPNITFSGGNFESESGDFPEIETGVQVLSFTETKTNTFMVSSKVLTKIT